MPIRNAIVLSRNVSDLEQINEIKDNMMGKTNTQGNWMARP
jgi:hypothetical protein